MMLLEQSNHGCVWNRVIERIADSFSNTFSVILTKETDRIANKEAREKYMRKKVLTDGYVPWHYPVRHTHCLYASQSSWYCAVTTLMPVCEWRVCASAHECAHFLLTMIMRETDMFFCLDGTLCVCVFESASCLSSVSPRDRWMLHISALCLLLCVFVCACVCVTELLGCLKAHSFFKNVVQWFFSGSSFSTVVQPFLNQEHFL